MIQLLISIKVVIFVLQMAYLYYEQHIGATSVTVVLKVSGQQYRYYISFMDVLFALQIDIGIMTVRVVLWVLEQYCGCYTCIVDATMVF